MSGRRTPAWIALALIAAHLALAGCGQKGPLFLPGSAADPAAQDGEADEREGDDDEQ